MSGNTVKTDTTYNYYPLAFQSIISIVVNITSTTNAGNSAGYYHHTKNITTSSASIQYYYKSYSCPFNAILLGY